VRLRAVGFTVGAAVGTTVPERAVICTFLLETFKPERTLDIEPRNATLLEDELLPNAVRLMPVTVCEREMVINRLIRRVGSLVGVLDGCADGRRDG
jgi:hypothetical protein